LGQRGDIQKINKAKTKFLTEETGVPNFILNMIVYKVWYSGMDAA